MVPTCRTRAFLEKPMLCDSRVPTTPLALLTRAGIKCNVTESTKETLHIGIPTVPSGPKSDLTVLETLSGVAASAKSADTKTTKMKW